MIIENVLQEIFQEVGIFVGDANEELFLDSMQFVSIIVAVEERLSVEIDDSNLINSQLVAFCDFVELVEQLIIS